MPFTFPDGLAPEAYPLAWLVGHWRGEGVISYPDIPETTFVQDVVFDHDGGPYLRYEATTRLPAVEPGADGPDGEETVWSTETGYWRVSPEPHEGAREDQASLEVLLADPAGRVSVYLGVAGNGRIDLVSDLIARTSTGADVSASKRMYGLVEGSLMWAWDLAAFGKPLQSYASAQLFRQEG